MKWPDFDVLLLDMLMFVVEVKEIAKVALLTEGTALKVAYTWDEVQGTLEDDLRQASKQFRNLKHVDEYRDLPRVLWWVTPLPLHPDSIEVSITGIQQFPTPRDVAPHYRGRKLLEYLDDIDIVAFQPVGHGLPFKVFRTRRRAGDALIQHVASAIGESLLASVPI